MINVRVACLKQDLQDWKDGRVEDGKGELLSSEAGFTGFKDGQDVKNGRLDGEKRELFIV